MFPLPEAARRPHAPGGFLQVWGQVPNFHGNISRTADNRQVCTWPHLVVTYNGDGRLRCRRLPRKLRAHALRAAPEGLSGKVRCLSPADQVEKPYQLQPVVVPQSMQTLQVPFWTMRELPQLGQVLPSYRRSPWMAVS